MRTIFVGNNHDPDFSTSFKITVEQKCACGHPLGHHGFTMHTELNGDVYFWVSQCVMCVVCKAFS